MDYTQLFSHTAAAEAPAESSDASVRNPTFSDAENADKHPHSASDH